MNDKAYALVTAALLLCVAGAYGYRHWDSRPPAALLVTTQPVTEVATSTKPVSLMFLGDVMLDRVVAKHARDVGDAALFAHVGQLFLGVDAVIANLEGTITDEASIAAVHREILRFTFDPHYALFLKETGITAVSLSNNHTDDFGKSGYASTKSYLDSANILSFGSPDNMGDGSTAFLIRGKRVCLVGYEDFIVPKPTIIADRIRTLRGECDFIAATMHAGVEYEPTYSKRQQEIAHAFIDAGADVVIGTHPHVVEPLEIYKDKAIFYSLGNFLFDQDFSLPTTRGLAVELEWNGTETRYQLTPIEDRHEEVVFPGEEARAFVLSQLIDADVPPAIASSIASTSSFTL